MTRYAILDAETSIRNKGSPFTPENKLCLVGIKTNDAYYSFKIEYDDEPYGDALRQIRDLLSESDVVIGFNLKFDLHWIKRYIPDTVFGRVWDCQLGEFILSNQGVTFPALGTSCEQRGFGSKLDRVALEYWALGIDTPGVPLDLLSKYLEQDCLLTEKLYLIQSAELVGTKRMLFKLQCEDLKILQEMEWNGMLYDFTEAARLAEDAKAKIEALSQELFDIAGSNEFDP